jgi:hypothetical protein
MIENHFLQQTERYKTARSEFGLRISPFLLTLTQCSDSASNPFHPLKLLWPFKNAKHDHLNLHDDVSDAACELWPRKAHPEQNSSRK